LEFLDNPLHNSVIQSFHAQKKYRTVVHIITSQLELPVEFQRKADIAVKTRGSWRVEVELYNWL
jgi:hypothetical protein